MIFCESQDKYNNVKKRDYYKNDVMLCNAKVTRYRMIWPPVAY